MSTKIPEILAAQGLLEGDFDGNGTVNFADFLALSGNFGKSSGGVAAAVPEPSSLALLGIGSLLFGMMRRRRN